MENSDLNSDRENIAARLKEARIMSGLSQAQAADQLGLKRPAISEIEAGNRRVTAEKLYSLLNRIRSIPHGFYFAKMKEITQNEYKFAAREVEKLSKEDIKKLLNVLKILPK